MTSRKCAAPGCSQRFEPRPNGRPRLYCSKACRDMAGRRRRRQLRPYFMSSTDEWSTPADLFARLNAEHHFTLDVCANADNAKCERYFSRADDALAQIWQGVCWMNPPYGRDIDRWVAKAYDSARAGATVVCLVPARTDTAWWQRFIPLGEVTFVAGRIKFNGSGSAPFPSAVVVFQRGFQRDGECVETRVETATLA